MCFLPNLNLAKTLKPTTCLVVQIVLVVAWPVPWESAKVPAAQLVHPALPENILLQVILAAPYFADVLLTRSRRESSIIAN